MSVTSYSNIFAMLTIMLAPTTVLTILQSAFVAGTCDIVQKDRTVSEVVRRKKAATVF